MFCVTTVQKTSYVILIKDIDKFNNFALNSLNNERNFKSFSDYYKNNYLKMRLYGKGKVTAREMGMLKALEGFGLMLTKGNSDFSDWKKIENRK